MMNIGAQQQDFSMLSDQQLKQAMMFAQRSNDTPAFLGLMAEANKRKQTRTAAQGQQAGQEVAQSPQTQADQVMSGIANLASGDQEYAGGGIVAFAKAGVVEEEKQRAEDRAGIIRGLRGLNAAGWDLLSLPGRAVAGAAETAITRPLRALGVDVPYLPESFYGGDRKSMTPYTDAIRREESRPVEATATPPTQAAPRVEARDKPYINPQAYRDYKGAEAAPAPSGGGASVRARATGATPPIAPAAAEPTPEWMKAPDARTLDQIIADRKKAAAEGEEGIKALMDPYTKKLEERRKKIEGETADSEGLLGLKWGDDKRKALRDFGLAMMAGKDPNALVNAGAAGQKAAEAYEKAKESRQARMDALDERDQKLAMARYEMSRGNRDEAAKLVKEAEEAGQTAFKNRFEIGKFGQETKDKAEDRAFREKQLKQQYELGIGQINASRAAAGRNAQLELYTALGGGDPRKGYEFAQTSRGEPAADLALWKSYASDPMKLEMLKTTNPQMYAMVMAKIASQGGNYVTAPAQGATVLPR